MMPAFFSPPPHIISRRCVDETEICSFNYLPTHGGSRAVAEDTDGAIRRVVSEHSATNTGLLSLSLYLIFSRKGCQLLRDTAGHSLDFEIEEKAPM